jgi:hypothetical protein
MKSAPAFLRYALLFLVAAGISAWAWRSFGPASKPAADNAPPGVIDPVTAPAHEILVTYFTTDARCPTCLKIEKQTREAMESAFADELASGTVRFETTNFDRPEFKHFIDTYELSFKTVVISDRHNGNEKAWAKFDDVWDLVEEPEAFATYLQDGVRKYLEPKTDA